MNKITPFLWFDGKAEEAANFYVSIFKDSKIISSTPMIVTFELKGQKFMALNGGPNFKFNEAVSFLIGCKDQKEIDYYWEKLSEKGKKGQCGWLKDKFGLSWQVVPSALGELLEKDNSGRVMKAILSMTKIEIKVLEDALSKK